MSLIRPTMMLVLAAVLLAGCGEGNNTPAQSASITEQGHTSEITEPMTGTRLRVTIESTEIDLAGMIVVHTDLQWAGGVTTQLIVPSWEDSGWESVREHREKIVFDGSNFSQKVSFELEPFLGGQYEVPSFGMRADSPTTGRRIARLQPMQVVVASALTESDDRTLDPIIGLAKPIEVLQDTSSSWIIFAGIGMAALCGIIAIVIRSRGKSTESQQINPEAILAIAASSAELTPDELGLLHRALIELSTEHAALEPISHEIERLRFSGSVVDHRRVQSSARRAIDACGIGGTRR